MGEGSTIAAADLEAALLAVTAACGRLAMIRQRCDFAEHALPPLTWAQTWGLRHAALEIAAFLSPVGKEKAA